MSGTRTSSTGGTPIPAAPRTTVPLSPWREAARRYAVNRTATAALALLASIVLVCLLAPVYADRIAHTDPFQSNIGGYVTVRGKPVAVMQPDDNPLQLGVSPIAPTWVLGADPLGADGQGRDVLARLLYGGRVSLLIGFVATLLCTALASLIGIVAGFFGGWVDSILSRLMDVMWAVPVYLIAISLSIMTVSHGLDLGPVTIASDNLLLPIVIIAIVYVPYVARPVRGHVLSLRRTDFVLAARGLGVPRARILLRDILPNVSTTVLTLAPLLMALNILAESALSFLTIAEQPPQARWGTIINDGQGLIYTRPAVALAPGIMIVLTVIALNLIGDGLRDALDPHGERR